jgi:hypothetical protein
LLHMSNENEYSTSVIPALTFNWHDDTKAAAKLPTYSTSFKP